MKLIIASNNKGKIREYKAMLGEYGYDEVLSLGEAGIVSEPEETGSTFEENAAIKARALYEKCGCAVIADDSGLMIDAFGGEPGVYSARWLGLESDDEKNVEILRRLEGVRKAERGARFVCAVHFIAADGSEVTAKGVCEGRIACEVKGDDGFGYDPIFICKGESVTFAQLTEQEKNERSHRGRALAELARKLGGAEK